MTPMTLPPPAPTPIPEEIGQTERVPPADPRAGLISVDPERHSGTPCFAGTRVPVRDLFDYLESDETLESFLESFPTVTREQAQSALRLAEASLLEDLSAR